MTPEVVMELGVGMLSTTALLMGPLVFSVLVVGLAVSLLQAVTQINEMTLSFVPKLLALSGVLVVLGPWMLNTLMDYTIRMFDLLPQVAR